MNPFEYMSALQYRVKAQKKQIEELLSGEKYIKLEQEYKTTISRLNQKIKKLEQELAQAHKETATVRKLWLDVMEDLEKEYRKKSAAKEKQIEKLNARMLKIEGQRDAAKDQSHEKQLQIYKLGTKLWEEKERNKKLTTQVNKDFENSSLLLSAQGPRRKKIPNSRVRTNRKPNGQPGHQGHRRKVQTPAQIHWIADPADYKENPDYYETGRIIRKQKTILQITADVMEYRAKEYRNRTTGARVHASFPKGLVNEATYDGSVKAFAFLLGTEGNVSHDKIRKLLSELTDGTIDVSKGMVGGLCREFSEKTAKGKQEIIRQLMTSPVMNVDFTNARVDGKNAQVLILTSPQKDAALYLGREKKGHKGVGGSPLEKYAGTVIHDHDKTFYSYGTKHQACIQHDCRYLIGSGENEPRLTWNQKMHELLQKMLHYRNGLKEEEEIDHDIVADFETQYDKILDKAQEEYEYEPPGKYYREGYSLFLHLRKYKESGLLFLHDKRVPANNPLCERLARVFKRKQKQAMTFRSQENLEYICDGLSIIHLLRSRNENVYKKVCDIFERTGSKSSKHKP